MKKLNELASQRKWTELLASMPLNSPIVVEFPDEDAIRSCKSVGYSAYGSLRGYNFFFACEKNSTKARITKTENYFAK